MIRATVRQGSICLVAVALMLGAASVASAQASDPKMVVAVGYGIMHDNGTSIIGIRQNFTRGWFGSVAANLTPMTGIAAEIAGNSRSEGRTFDCSSTAARCFNVSNQNFWSFLAGPRVRIVDRRVTIFGQGLFGIAKSNSNVMGVQNGDTGFEVMPGAGFIFNFSDHVGLGAGIHEQIVKASDRWNTGVKFQIGLAFHK